MAQSFRDGSRSKRPSSPVLEGTVRINALPRSFVATVANWSQSLLRYEIEDYAMGREAWI